MRSLLARKTSSDVAALCVLLRCSHSGGARILEFATTAEKPIFLSEEHSTPTRLSSRTSVSMDIYEHEWVYGM